MTKFRHQERCFWYILHCVVVQTSSDGTVLFGWEFSNAGTFSSINAVHLRLFRSVNKRYQKDYAYQSQAIVSKYSSRLLIIRILRRLSTESASIRPLLPIWIRIFGRYSASPQYRYCSPSGAQKFESTFSFHKEQRIVNKMGSSSLIYMYYMAHCTLNRYIDSSLAIEFSR